MKKSKLTRVLSLLMVALFMMTFIVSCVKDGDKDGKGPGTVSPLETGTDEDPNIAPVDFDGYEFSILVRPFYDGQAYGTDFMVSEGEAGDTLLDAVYRRNVALEDKYNIKIAQIETADLVTTVRTQVMGGDTEFDVIHGTAISLATLAREKHLLDLNSVEYFDMTKSYWDANAAEELLIGDKLYFTNCDMNVQEVAFVVYFNKQIIEDYDLTSPYEYMANNEWTIDNWAALVKSVSKEMDGDGIMTEFDQYGTLYEHHNSRMFLYGAGIRATTNDETGYPQVTVMSDKTVSAYEKLKAVFSDSDVTWCINCMPADSHGFNDKWDYARSLFCQDLYLFHYEGTNIIAQFADMESEFGIVPFPKYDSSQDKYYSQYPVYCSLIALPTTTPNIERTGKIFEDMNYFSSFILQPAWFNTLLSRRYTRDDESEASLAIIKEGRVYDIGLCYNFGGLRSSLLDVDAANANISTNYAKIQKAINADITSVYKDFTK